jgi:predicted transcriptional regulator
MKREHSIACIFCMILIGMSLIHLHNYGKCRRRAFEAVHILRHTEKSNMQMHRNVQERVLQFDTLRHISGRGAVHQRHQLEEAQGLKRDAYKLLHTLRDITKMGDIVQERHAEEKVAERAEEARQRAAAKQRAKILPPPLEGVHEPDYLLIEPNR